MRLAHSLADTLITPLNDSFVDLDVLGGVDPRTFEVTATSHYSQMVQGSAPQAPARPGIHRLDCLEKFGYRRSIRATSGGSEAACNSLPDGWIFAAWKDWPSGPFSASFIRAA